MLSSLYCMHFVSDHVNYLPKRVLYIHVLNVCSVRIDMLLICFLFISSNVFKYLIACRSNTALVILPLRVVLQAVPPDFLRVYAEFSDDALRMCLSASTLASSFRAIWSIHSTQISLIIIWNSNCSMFIIVQFRCIINHHADWN